MADSDTFQDDLATFVRVQAQGNKTRAAALLEITRQEVYGYLAGRKPRADKLSRLQEALAESDAELGLRPTEVDPPAETAFQLIRYLYHLVENARARS